MNCILHLEKKLRSETVRLLFLLAFDFWIGPNFQFSNLVILNICFIVISILNHKNFKTNFYMKHIFWFIFLFFLLCSFFINRLFPLSWKLIKQIILLAFIAHPFAEIVEEFIKVLFKVINNTYQLDLKLNSFKLSTKRIFIILFLLWMPYALIYFPGIFGYDAPDQIYQLGGYSSQSNPIVHTIIISSFYRASSIVGNPTIGIFLYVLLQMSVFAYAISRFLNVAMDACKNGKARYQLLNIIFLLFFALHPFFPYLAISTTKDTFFISFLILFLTEVIDSNFDCKYFQNHKKLIRWSFFQLCVIVFRKNGFYIMLLMLPTTLFLYKKIKKAIYIIALQVIAIVCSILINSTLIMIMNSQKGMMNEAYSLIMQPIAQTYMVHKDELSPEIKKDILEVLPSVEKYYPYLSDPIKADANIYSNKLKTIRIFFELMRHYPENTVDAILRVTEGYWSLTTDVSGKVYGIGIDSQQGLISSKFLTGHQVEQMNLFPKARYILEWLFSANHCYDLPVISVFFNLSLYLWIIFYCFVEAIIHKRQDTIYPYVFVFFLILTIIAGPCSIYRYAMAYIALTPLVVFAQFQKG